MFLENILFLRHKPKAEIKELVAAVGLNNLAASMIMLFEPVFLYQLGFTLSGIMLYYAVLYSVYFFILPLAGKIASRFGFEHSILYSNPIFIIYLAVLFLASFNHQLVWLAAVIFAINKTFYWPAFHANFARYSSVDSRGRELSSLNAISLILTVLGPLAGGIILKFSGFGALFLICSIIILISSWPLVRTREKFVPTDFSYSDSFDRLRHRKFRPAVISFLGFAEELLTLTVWPLFMFIIFKNSYLSFGAISAISVGLAILISYYIGYLVDKKNDRHLKNPLVIIYAFSWLWRAVSQTPLLVALGDVYNKTAKTGLYLPYFSLIYRQANRRGNLKYSLIMEMSLALAKAVIAWVLFFVFILWPSFSLAFVFAGALSLLYLIL